MATPYYTATSIDGFVADSDSSLDWLFQVTGTGAEDMKQEYPRFFADVGALAMGSTTYQWVLDRLDDAADSWPYELPTWVFSSRQLPRPDGADVRFVSGHVGPVHAEMVAAAQGRNVWLVGGGDLVGQFHDAGLLDEVLLSVAPVFLGSGAPLLPRRVATPPLELLETRAYGSTFVTLRYAVPLPPG